MFFSSIFVVLQGWMTNMHLHCDRFHKIKGSMGFKIQLLKTQHGAYQCLMHITFWMNQLSYCSAAKRHFSLSVKIFIISCSHCILMIDSNFILCKLKLYSYSHYSFYRTSLLHSCKINYNVVWVYGYCGKHFTHMGHGQSPLILFR